MKCAPVVALKVAAVCGHPVEAPADALLERLDARHGRARCHGDGDVAMRQVNACGIEVAG
jgi:hypothetical protein